MGQYWIPRSKRGLVDLIAKSEKWTGTKASLRAMEKPQLVEILKRFRNEHFNVLMKFDKKSAETQNISDNTNTKNEVENDRPNNDVGRT